MFIEGSLGQSEEMSPLPKDHFVLIPSPAFLVGVSMAKTESNLSYLLFEYASMFELLAHHVGGENIRIVRNSVATLKKTGTSQRTFTRRNFSFPDTKNFQNITLGAAANYSTVWVRDGFQAIDPYTFINPAYFPGINESQTIKKSMLSEGGMVLHAQRVVLVSDALWQTRRTDRGFNCLEEAGYVIAPLPEVIQSKQKYEFNEAHIDGHAALIVDKNQRLQLLVAESYSRQGNGTRKDITRAAEAIGAGVFEIDDRNLVPLSLNLVQFEDGTIIVSKGQSNDLIFVLQNMVGEDKVLITEVPIVQIPQFLFGSIRCLINIIPKSFLETISVS